jgi:hypothetical protein
MVMSGPLFDTKVRRARADINDALGMAPQVPQPMMLPPAGLPPQGMMRQPAVVRPLPVPLQGPYPAGRLPMATQSRAVSPQGMPPQSGALGAPSIQQAQQQTAAPRPFMVGGYVEAPDPGPMALSNMSAQQLRRYYGGNYPTDNGPIGMAGGGMAVRPMRRPNPYEAEILATDWAKGYQKKYGEQPDVSDASDYDYETAWRLGVRPKATKHDDLQHWSSRAPDGTMLKKKGHPTAWKEEYMQATGKDPDDVGHTQEQWERLKTSAKKHPLMVNLQRFAAGGGAWTRKEGKNPEGGLNAKGRASLKAQGHDIKPPVSAKLAAKSPKAAARRKSFCARMSGMPGPMKDEQGRPTRKALSLRKWDC